MGSGSQAVLWDVALRQVWWLMFVGCRVVAHRPSCLPLLLLPRIDLIIRLILRCLLLLLRFLIMFRLLPLLVSLPCIILIPCLHLFLLGVEHSCTSHALLLFSHGKGERLGVEHSCVLQFYSCLVATVGRLGVEHSCFCCLGGQLSHGKGWTLRG